MYIFKKYVDIFIIDKFACKLWNVDITYIRQL